MPLDFWERASRRELVLRYRDNAILGFGPASPGSRRPPDSNDAEDNGNAAHHSVALYQGPLVWEWDWQGDPVEHLRPVLGRWAALAVRIDHEVPEAPVVVTRVLDSGGNVLAERLAEAAPANTVSTAADAWRTEYVFELPGSLYQAGNQIIHVIDPDNELAETDEDDNVGAPISLYGVELAPFRATFIPLHFPGDVPPSVGAEALMSGVRAYLPIADDYEVQVGPAHESRARDLDELLDEVHAIWNAEGDADEYYHGVFLWPWLGGSISSPRTAGIALLNGNAAVSVLAPSRVVPHEFGHNLGLRHPPGCTAQRVDSTYPYRDGGLGPLAGWDVQWRRFVSNDDEGHTDLMSYCGRFEFVSDYHYRNALAYRLRRHPARSAIGMPSLARSNRAISQATVAVSQSPSGTQPSSAESGDGGGPASSGVQQGTLEPLPGTALALSGRIDAAGQWSLTHTRAFNREPRAPAPDGPFTLILFDGEGEELYREPLSFSVLSHGAEAGWAARTPVPTEPVRQVAIVDAEGLEVLRQELPAFE